MSATTAPEADGLAQRRVGLELEAPIGAAPPLPVVFDLPDFELEGGVITMRALDDLAGCASIIAALERVVRSQESANVYAVFTRAEEAGLYGARLVAESGVLPEETLVVSVESSSVILGVAQGAGPIIRTGDRASTFDDEAEQALVSAAEALGKVEGGLRVQRQLMTGGTCEATAFGAVRVQGDGACVPAWELPQRDDVDSGPGRGRRGGAHPAERLPGWGGSAAAGGCRGLREREAGVAAGGAGGGARPSQGLFEVSREAAALRIVSKCSILRPFVCGLRDCWERFWTVLGHEWTLHDAV